MRKLRVARPVLLLSLLWLALYQDHSGLVRIGLLAAVLHESGHVLIYLALFHRLPVLRLSPFGIGLDLQEITLTPGRGFLLAAAGPAANFLVCGLTLAAMQLRAGYWGFFFAGANCALGLFNLLPLGVLDGRKMWQFVRMWGLQLRRK